MDECKRHQRKLVIAKLDRLSRDVEFISGLFKSKVDFVAADNPFDNKLTIHILAAMAQHEREIISARIKAALAVKKVQLAKEGKKLGGPRPLEALALANAAKQRATPPPEVRKADARLAAGKEILLDHCRGVEPPWIRTGRFTLVCVNGAAAIEKRPIPWQAE